MDNEQVENKLIEIEAENMYQNKYIEELYRSNKEEHKNIENKLDASFSFQRRLRWVGGTILVIVGTIIGWVSSHIEWLWNILPMHKHTH